MQLSGEFNRAVVNPSAPKYEPEVWYGPNWGKIHAAVAHHLHTENITLRDVYDFSVAKKLPREDRAVQKLAVDFFKNPPPILRSNCYGYAMNDQNNPEGMFRNPSPGQKSGEAMFFSHDDIMPQRLKKLAQSDGLEPAPLDAVKKEMPEGKYLVAMFVAPYTLYGKKADYHFMRQDQNGAWSYQGRISGDIEQSLNEDGTPTKDPSQISFHVDNIQYDFVSFFYAPAGGMNVGIDGAAPVVESAPLRTTPSPGKNK